MVEHGVAEHEIERLVVERQLRRVARDGLHLHPDVLGVPGERVQHPRSDVGAGRRPDHALLHQVDREVPGARADLERALERARRRPEQLAHLAQHLLASDLAEGDAPLGVVVACRGVVVTAVDVEDLGGGRGSGHRAA